MSEFFYKLFLDDERYPSDKSHWIIARNFDDAVWYVENYGLPAFISFDHDLGHPQNRTGMDFAKWLCDWIMDNDKSIDVSISFDYYVHSQNPVGAENIRHYMENFLNYFRNPLNRKKLIDAFYIHSNISEQNRFDDWKKTHNVDWSIYNDPEYVADNKYYIEFISTNNERDSSHDHILLWEITNDTKRKR